MEKRLPLALLLSLLFVWAYLQMTAPPPSPEGAATAATAGEATRSGAGSVTGGPVAGSPGASPGPGALPGAGGEPAPAVPEEPGRPVPFEGVGYRAQFDTRGGVLSWLELTDYHTQPGGADALRIMGATDDGAGHFQLRDFNKRYPLGSVNWDLEERRTPEGHAQLVFRWTSPDGLLFTRTVTDRGERSSFDLALEVTNTTAKDPGGALSLVLQGPNGLHDDHGGGAFSGGTSAVAVVQSGAATEVKKWEGSSLQEAEPRAISGTEKLLATGTMTNYFVSLLVPQEDTFATLVQPEAVLDVQKLADAVAAKHPADEAEAAGWRQSLRKDAMTNAVVDVVLAKSFPGPGETARFDFKVFAGAKNRLLAEQPGFQFLQPILEDAFGSMAWINHALLAILRFFEHLTGNWGWAIVLLVVLVRLLLFPLNRVQQSSMAKYGAAMQRLKPELDALKAKYKGNTRKFSEEQMKLLKREGVSPPLGGCLLMFLQFPVWISLFQILRSSIELRHAGFIFWVHDLSRPDAMPLPFGAPFNHVNLLPILMAIASVVQLRFQPKPADESQAQMQKIMGIMMPVMMLVFLYSYPSGLSLYIFTSSVLGIVEYKVIRTFWPTPGATPVPAAAAAGRKSPAKA